MAQHDLLRAQEILQYEFNNMNLLAEALQAPGPGAIVGGAILEHGNRKLALLGLCALELSISQAGYLSGSTQGKMTWKHLHLVSQFTIADLYKNRFPPK